MFYRWTQNIAFSQKKGMQLKKPTTNVNILQVRYTTQPQGPTPGFSRDLIYATAQVTFCVRLRKG